MGFVIIWQRLIFPGRCHPSIVSTGKLNFCVRYGNRCGLPVITTRTLVMYIQNYIMHFLRKKEGCASNSEIWSSPRPISTGLLNALLRLHFRPIHHVFFMGPYSINWMGYLILRWVSRLDAFSVYPCQTWLPSCAIGMTTGPPSVCPSRSSRTKDRSSQISCARDR